MFVKIVEVVGKDKVKGEIIMAGHEENEKKPIYKRWWFMPLL